MIHSKNPKESLLLLSSYLSGMASMSANHEQVIILERSADWLERTSREVCGQGFIGCEGGDKCSSDHK